MDMVSASICITVYKQDKHVSFNDLVCV